MRQDDNGNLWVMDEPEPYVQDRPQFEDRRKRQFIMVDYIVLESIAEMGRNAFAVYCVLLRCMNNERMAWPSWKRLMRLSGLSRNMIGKALKTLENRGFLTRMQGRRKGAYSSNMYYINDLYENNVPENISPSDQNTEYHKTVHGETILHNSLSRSRSFELDPEKKGGVGGNNIENGPQTPDGFDRFWQLYPRKVAKAKARAIWQRKQLDHLTGQICESVKRHIVSSPQWQNPQYIPHPATYLNQERWEDDVPAVQAVQQDPVLREWRVQPDPFDGVQEIERDPADLEWVKGQVDEVMSKLRGAR